MAKLGTDDKRLFVIATVQAIGDCELIEIPMGTLDMVLFSKPAWSKALVATLSRRLKRSNQTRVQES